MGRHVILGKGKLGIGLMEALQRQGHEAILFSRSIGWIYPSEGAIRHIDDQQADVVWCAIGAGSVEKCLTDYDQALSLHVGLPVALLTKLKPKTHVILFSTDYVADEEFPNHPGRNTLMPRSLYAMSKLTMEQHFHMIARKSSTCIRIGNLYSSRIMPGDCFPGKVLEHNKGRTQINLPSNMVTPTPVEWLADYLVRKLPYLINFGPKILHAAPSGTVSLCDWATHFVPHGTTIYNVGPDERRPMVSELGCTIEPTPHWVELWNVYGTGFTGTPR